MIRTKRSASAPLIVALLGALCCSSTALALTREAFESAKATERLQSYLTVQQDPTLDYRPLITAEANTVRALYADYLAEQASFTSVVGVVRLAGNSPVYDFLGGGIGLSFIFIDPTTGLQVIGPQVASVLYEVNSNPVAPDRYDVVGISFDSARNFSFSAVFSGGWEPDIRGIPLDANGRPIFIAGAGGQNVAQASAVIISVAQVPEPSAFMLLSVGALGALGMRRKRHKESIPR